MRRIEWLLHDHGADRHSLVIGEVGVINVDVEEGGESVAAPLRCPHYPKSFFAITTRWIWLVPS